MHRCENHRKIAGAGQLLPQSSHLLEDTGPLMPGVADPWALAWMDDRACMPGLHRSQ